jgi:hypothetical protein
MNKIISNVKQSYFRFTILVASFFAPLLLEAGGFVAPSATQPPAGALPSGTDLEEGTSLIDAVEALINWVLGFVGILLFSLFLFAAFQYATAGGDETKTAKARATMLNAVIGMIIIFFVFVLSNAVLWFVFNGLGD